MTDRSIEYRHLDAIVPAETNPKRHDLSEIRASMARFGYTEPLLLDGRTDRLVAGHGRLETLAAARAGGLPAPDGIQVEDGQWLVPIVTGWASADDAEAEAYLVASNRLVEAGGWDDGMLADMLVDLRGTTAGLSGVGFDDAALDELLASLGRDVPVSEHTRHIGDPDDVPPVPDEPVTKPVDLFRPLIENSTPPGGMVLDPFMGSGTTIVAADQCGRRAFGLEISPHYVDVALARYQGLTGEKPVLESTGEPHDFLAAG